MASKLSAQMKPTLDGHALTRDRSGGLRYADGTPIDPARTADVVYISAEAEAPFSLEAALAGIAPPVDEDDLDAGFFHRTLARWLGLPEGVTPGARKSAPVLWSYDFWKAELIQLDVDGKRQHWEARVYRGNDREPEHYRYWIELDKRQRIKTSGWVSTPPDLLAERSQFATSAPVDLAAAATTLFDESSS